MLRKRGKSSAECKDDCHCKDSYDENAPKERKDTWRATALRAAILLLFLVAVVRVSVKSSFSPSLPHIKKQKRARFPKYGSKEFAQQCNWTLVPPDTPEPKCSILVRPPVRSNEGIADWASQITRAYMQARQAGCKLVFDYGLDVDISQVLVPYTDHAIHNWTVPSEVKCNDICQNSISFKFGDWAGKKFQRVPYFRHVFTFSHDYLYPGDYAYMSQALPGFDMATGMACALGNLFQLSPVADQFEPNLYTKLLPALQDEDALVLALYMRTNRADVMAVNEKKNESVAPEQAGKYNSTVESFAKMAHCLEEQYLTGLAEAGVDITRVYWIALSDSPEAKKTVIEGYSGKDANERIPEESRKYKSRVIPREVLATGARGIHVRAERNPSTLEFAEAFLDWYLIGESDAVITDQTSSFGPTGAMRTNRPIYRGPKCEKLPLIHELSEKEEREAKALPARKARAAQQVTGKKQ